MYCSLTFIYRVFYDFVITSGGYFYLSLCVPTWPKNYLKCWPLLCPSQAITCKTLKIMLVIHIAGHIDKTVN
jgi:hypothetical protein